MGTADTRISPVAFQIRHPIRFMAALLALLLLSYASVRSTVMQAVADPLGAMPMCGAELTAPAMNRASRADPKGHVSPKSCPYCAAAAHLPLACGSASLPASTTVHFVAYRLEVLYGPRGPPAVQPRARDPPAPSLSI